MRIKGSFTIEAVLIMPVIIFIIVFIIYLSFYLHDYCKIRGLTDKVLYKASMNLKHEADFISGRVNFDEINNELLSGIFGKQESKEKEIENYISRLLSKGLINTEISDVNVTMGAANITVRVEGSFKASLMKLISLISSDNTLVVESKAACHYPADTVRISEVILDTGSKIKGFDKLKEDIGKLMPEQ